MATLMLITNVKSLFTMEQYYDTSNLYDDYIADQNKGILKIVVGCFLVAGAATVIYFVCRDIRNKKKKDETTKS